MYNFYRITLTAVLVLFLGAMDKPLPPEAIAGWSAAGLLFLLFVLDQGRERYDPMEWLTDLFMSPILLSVGIYLFVSQTGWAHTGFEPVFNIIPQWLAALGFAIAGIWKFIKP